MKPARKKASILWAAVLVVGLGWVSSYAALQFYQPNRGARLIVYLKAKAKYSAWSHVVVTVMLSNQTTGKLLINNRLRTNRYPLDGELSFIIRGPDGQECAFKKAVSPREILDSEIITLGVGETTEQSVDLTDVYGMSQRGTYRIQVLYYNRTDLDKDGLSLWRGVIASEPVEITLQ